MAIVNVDAPTSPALGKSSDAVSGGLIRGDFEPFLKVGGGIQGEGREGISLAGRSKLGRHVYLRDDAERQRIIGGVRTQRLQEYVADLTAQGFQRVNNNRYERKEGGYTQRVNINWGSGDVSGVTIGPKQAKSPFEVLEGIERGSIQASPGAAQRLRDNLYGAPVQKVSLGVSGTTGALSNFVSPTPKSSSGSKSSSSSSLSAGFYSAPAVSKAASMITKKTTTPTPVSSAPKVFVATAKATPTSGLSSFSKAVTNNLPSSFKAATTVTKQVTSGVAPRTVASQVNKVVSSISSIFKKKVR